MVKDIKQVKRFILISEPIKYEIKYKQALIKGSQKFIKRLIAVAGGISFSLGLFWIQRSASVFLN